MEESATTRINTRTKPPVYIFLICLIGFLGVIAAFLGQFTSLHPLLKPAGWIGFMGANIILVLNSTFRKKCSDIVGEFHAYNMISWMISIMLATITILVVGLGLLVMARASSTGLDLNRLFRIIQNIAVLFAFPIAYGWIRWLAKKR